MALTRPGPEGVTTFTRRIRTFIEGEGPMTDTRLRLDLEWDTLLTVQEEMFFGGENFALEGVPVDDVEIPLAGDEKVVITFQTGVGDLTEKTVLDFQNGVRKVIARNQDPPSNGMAQEPARILVSSHIQGKGGLPRPFRQAKPVLHAEIPGKPMQSAVLEDSLRETLGVRVDVVEAGDGYNITFDSDVITLDQTNAIAEELREEVRVDTDMLIFYADRSKAPAP